MLYYLQQYLPHLSSLDVVSHSGFEGLMDGWNFPSLRSLWIRLEWKVYGEDEQGEQIAVGAPRWPQVAFQQFIMRSSCSITDLFLINIELDSEDLIGIITSVHISLRYLHVSGLGRDRVPFADDSVLFMLTWDDASISNVCPSLKKIDFVECLTFSQGVFAQMVMFRAREDARRIAKLEEVYVQCREDLSMSQTLVLTDFKVVKGVLPGFSLSSGVYGQDIRIC